MPANDVLLYENPWMPNPRKHRRHHRNPNIAGGFKKVGNTMFGGLRIEEVLGAVAGFLASATVPGYIIKTPDTTWKKVGKLGIGLGFALLGKVLFSNPKVGGVGKAWLYGGIAGTGALALKTYKPDFPTINANRPTRFGGAPGHLGPTAPQPAGLGRSSQDEFTTAAPI